MRIPDGWIEAEGVRALDRAVTDPPLFSPRASLADVVRQMDRKRIRYAAVAGPHRRLLGIVTRRDLAQGMVELDESPERVLVARVMRTDLFTVSPMASLAEAARMMERHGVRRIPIVGANGVLLGLIDLDRSRPNIRGSADRRPRSPRRPAQALQGASALPPKKSCSHSSSRPRTTRLPVLQ